VGISSSSSLMVFPLPSFVISSNSEFNNSYTAGNGDTTGFIRYHAIYRSISVCTQHKYGVCGYGYGMGKSDLWYTRVQPYMNLVASPKT
jgi:hypothetical protein